MRILLSIPCLYGAEHTEESIKSVVNKDFVDLLLIDNGAEPSVKAVIDKYLNYKNVSVIRNDTNVYVNKAWQSAINYFLAPAGIGYSHLILMNSDLIMHPKWDVVLINRIAEDNDEIAIPKMIDDKFFNQNINIETSVQDAEQVHSGTAGVFIVMNRKQAEIVSPLPFEYCKVWFGDNWIYEILRQIGFKTVIPNNLLAYHYWSQNVQKVQGISEIIEDDKRHWEIYCVSKMQEIIDKNKQNRIPIEINKK